MKIIITILALLIFVSNSYAEIGFVSSVADEVQCAFTKTATNTDKTTGTAIVRVQRVSDNYYWNWTSSSFDSSTYNNTNHGGSLTYRGESGETYRGNGWSRAWTPSSVSSETIIRVHCVSDDSYNYALKGRVYPANRFDDTANAVTVGTINTDVINAASIADGAFTPAKEYVIAGTVNATSTTLRVYTTLGVTGARTYNNMCLYSASNGERSRIMSTGNGYFNVRGFSVAPTDTTVLRIYADGCL